MEAHEQRRKADAISDAERRLRTAIAISDRELIDTKRSMIEHWPPAHVPPVPTPLGRGPVDPPPPTTRRRNIDALESACSRFIDIISSSSSPFQPASSIMYETFRGSSHEASAGVVADSASQLVMSVKRLQEDSHVDVAEPASEQVTQAPDGDAEVNEVPGICEFCQREAPGPHTICARCSKQLCNQCVITDRDFNHEGIFIPRRRPIAYELPETTANNCDFNPRGHLRSRRRPTIAISSTRASRSKEKAYVENAQ